MQHLGSRGQIAAVLALGAGLLVPLFNSGLAADLGGTTVAYDDHRSETRRRFYIRGDVGIGRHQAGPFSQSELMENGGSIISSSIGDTVYLGAGLGWQLTRRLRMDLTGEYRSTAQVKALDNLTIGLADPEGTLQANTIYHGSMKSYVGLLNVYYDMFTVRGFTPYVGAGFGLARNISTSFTTSSSATFTDAASGERITELTQGLSSGSTQNSFAWALMAGTSYDLNSNAKLDLGYRYLNMGSGTSLSSGLINCLCGTTGSPLKVSDLDSHEIRLGIRWMLDAGSAAYAPMK